MTTPATSNWNPTKYPIPPSKELHIEYDKDLDILTLWTGTPTSIGSNIARDLMVFFDEDDTPQVVTLEGARSCYARTYSLIHLKRRVGINNPGIPFLLVADRAIAL